MRSFQIFMYLIIASTFIACGNNKNDAVQFQILNKNLYYFQNDNERVINYKNESERDKSFNLVKFKLTNNSNKKMLFIINSVDLIDAYGLKIKIKEGNKFLKGANVLIHNVMDNCTECYFTSMNEVTKLDSYKLGKLGANGNLDLFKKYRLQSVILNPDESRIFTSLISLPCVIEDEVILTF